MSAKEIIDSLIGLRLELVDEHLFEQFRFGTKTVVQIFGEKGGPIAGPVFEYVIRHDGRVEFGFGDGVVRFAWDKVEMREDSLIVQSGTHLREHSFAYRPVKRFAIMRDDVV